MKQFGTIVNPTTGAVTLKAQHIAAWVSRISGEPESTRAVADSLLLLWLCHLREASSRWVKSSECSRSTSSRIASDESPLSTCSGSFWSRCVSSALPFLARLQLTLTPLAFSFLFRVSLPRPSLVPGGHGSSLSFLLVGRLDASVPPYPTEAFPPLLPFRCRRRNASGDCSCLHHRARAYPASRSSRQPL